MSILKVARLGHPVLRTRARPLEENQIKSQVIQKLVDDMIETMHEYQGVGLAAPQVHIGLRLFVAGVDDPEVGVSPVVMVNPEISPIGEAAEDDWEGCLSVPDIRGRVSRQAEILVRALDRHGHERTMTASGFEARMIQHETDHLDGVLFLDRMSSFDSLTYLAEYDRYWDNAETSGDD